MNIFRILNTYLKLDKNKMVRTDNRNNGRNCLVGAVVRRGAHE